MIKIKYTFAHHSGLNMILHSILTHNNKCVVPHIKEQNKNISTFLQYLIEQILLIIVKLCCLHATHLFLMRYIDSQENLYTSIINKIHSIIVEMCQIMTLYLLLSVLCILNDGGQFAYYCSLMYLYKGTITSFLLILSHFNKIYCVA